MGFFNANLLTFTKIKSQ